MTPPTDFKSLVNIFLGLINPLLLVLAGLSLLVFFIGLVAFIFQSGDVKAHEEGKARMKWGLVGLFVMVSLWGLIQLIYGNFFTGSIGFPLLPGGVR